MLLALISAAGEGTVGSARVVPAAVVSPVTSFQILKRLAISRGRPPRLRDTAE